MHFFAAQRPNLGIALLKKLLSQPRKETGEIFSTDAKPVTLRLFRAASQKIAIRNLARKDNDLTNSSR